MWDVIKGHSPGWLAYLCTILIFAIPYTVYKINQFLNDYGNPSWKKKDNTEE